MSLKTWISAFRLRTLPLAASGILMGTYCAGIYGEASWNILGYALLTAILLQILSNLANDYGDHLKGTDNENRIGNTRALQSGRITAPQMLMAIVLFSLAALMSGIKLLYVALQGHITLTFVLFFLIGIAAIAAAIKYTVGKNPYGYSGRGDVMVFIFFGLVAVCGTFLLHTHMAFNLSKHWPVVLAATMIGLLSTGVLNTNNIRDIANDQACGKITIPVKIGLQWARVYHQILIGGAILCGILFISFSPVHSLTWMALLATIPLLKQLKQVKTLAPSAAYNALLKQLSLGTLLLVVLFILTAFLANLFELAQLIPINK